MVHNHQPSSSLRGKPCSKTVDWDTGLSELSQTGGAAGTPSVGHIQQADQLWKLDLQPYSGGLHAFRRPDDG